MKYGYKRQTGLTYEAAIVKVREELQKEGFGILTEIDVKATLKKKLGVEFDKYTILGACNPPFAYQALQAETDIGILMPCNVIVYEHGGKVFMACVLPTVTMKMVDNPRLAEIAPQVEQKLKRAMDNV